MKRNLLIVSIVFAPCLLLQREKAGDYGGISCRSFWND